jgi:3',5'-cyclic AMP phosphodiesterase CpdA
MRFLHISDVHVTADYRKVPLRRLEWRRLPALYKVACGGRGKDWRDAPAVLAQIARDFRARGAHHLIVSGDLTGYGLMEEFEAAREALGPLADDSAACTAIPGNHDAYTPSAVSERGFERCFGHLLRSDLPEYCREGAYPFVRLLGDEVAVVGTLSARVLVPGVSFGWVGRPQLEGLRALLEDPRVARRAVLVVVHHAPLTAKGKRDFAYHRLVDGRALLDVVRGPARAVLHGHIHRRYHHEATATRPHLFGAGSSTQLGREGYWLIDVEGGRISGRMLRPGELG